MNNKELNDILYWYKNNPEAELMCFRDFLKQKSETQYTNKYILKQNPEADFHMQNKGVRFLWKLNSRCAVEMKVEKLTYYSNGELKDYYIIELFEV